MILMMMMMMIIFFHGMIGRREAYIQPEAFLEILTIAYLQHVVRRISLLRRNYRV